MSKEKTTKRFNLKGKLIIITSAILAMLVIATLLLTNGKIENFNPTGEIARTMTYEKVKEGDGAKDTGSQFVEFDAFFLRDIDGDGIADGVRGTCRKVGEYDTLYMQLNVLTDGHLEEGVIRINSDNFYLETAIPKDNEVRENAIGLNIKEIKLNNINNGTQKLLTGIVRSGDYAQPSTITSAIGKNAKNYSKINSITLTGVHVSDNEEHTRTPIYKKVDFKVDWHGYTKMRITNLEQKGNIDTGINQEKGELKIDFTIYTEETKEELILKRAVVEGTIPQLNNQDPIRVESTNSNVKLKYNDQNRTFIAEKESTLNEETGLVTNTISKYNNFQISVVYPLSAFTDLGQEYINLRIPVKAYYEGHNNPNPEFKNPERSNEENQIILVSYMKPVVQQYDPSFQIRVGKYVYRPTERYLISKEKPLKIYNEISSEEKDDNYTVEWRAYTGTNGESSGITMKETPKDASQKLFDEFIKQDGTTKESMEELTSNIGIYFSNPSDMLGEDGEIKIYDDETDEVLGTFNKQNWTTYTSTKPYIYSEPVRHIRVETSKTKANTILYVYNIKQLDDEYITNHYEKEKFDELSYIQSNLSGYLGENYIATSIHKANYEEPYSIASLYLSKSAISTQKTEKNMKITINANANTNENQVKWVNGAFLLKLPENIVDVELNSVTSEEKTVKISSYEQFIEDGICYIKINTENTNPTTYSIVVDADITPDPRIVTQTQNIELHYYNANAVQYWETTKDEKDVNDNLNKNEKIGITLAKISLISPDSLLTSQTAANYDDDKNIAVGPQIALVTKNQSTADIIISMTNNYSSTVSEVKVLGRIPFSGNKYTINGTDLGSNFDTKMKGPIRLSEKLQKVATVYYSTNEDATKDLGNPANDWKRADQIVDFSTVKSYLIDLGNYTLQRTEQEEFSYTIEIPRNLNYNQVSYSHHAVYFSLDTEAGKFRTQTEPNKIGFMIAKQYDLELIKYQAKTESTVPGATYFIMEADQNDGKEEGKTRVTGEDGKLVLQGLYVDRTYIVKEIKTPTSYELNPTEFRFKATEKDGRLELVEEETTDDAKNIRIIEPQGEEGYKVQIEVEDEVKASLKIVKIEKAQEEQIQNKISGVRFRIIGKNFENGRTLTTNRLGEVSLSGLSIEAEYSLEEVKAEGYYLTKPMKFKINNNEGTYELQWLKENSETTVTASKPELVKEASVTQNGVIPVINFTIENEKIPTYNLQINKIVKGEEERSIAGAKFRLYKGTQRIGDYITDTNGIITIDNLYQYEETRKLDQTYTLKELMAPDGYATIKDITFQVSKDAEGMLTLDVKDGKIKNWSADAQTNKVTIIIEDSPSFKLIKVDGEEADEGQEVRLPNTKFAMYSVENGVDQVALDSKSNILGTKEVINGKTYYTLTTNAQGEIEANLKEGLYKAVEIEASDEKYDITDKVYYFGIGASMEVPQVLVATEAKNISESTNKILMAETSDGGYVKLASFSGTITLGEYTLETKGSSKRYVAKYDADGNVQWATAISGNQSEDYTALAVGKNDEIVIGLHYRSYYIYLGEEVIRNSKSLYDDSMIIKYAPTGESGKYELDWYTTITGSGAEKLSCIALGENGEIIAGVNYLNSYITVGSERFENKSNVDSGNSMILYSDALIVKYVPVDNEEKYAVEWATSIGNELADTVSKISITEDGGLLATGNIGSESVEIGNYTLGKGGMVIKYMTDEQEKYTVEWATSIGGNIGSAVETQDKGILIGGYFNTESVEIGGYTLNNHSSSKYDSMIIKYMTDEQEKYKVSWATSFGGENDDYINSINETSDGGFIIGGRSNSQVISIEDQVLRNKSSGTSGYGSGTYSGIIIKYKPNQNDYSLDLMKSIGESGSNEIYSVEETNDGKYKVYANIGGNINLEDGTSIKGIVIIKYDPRETSISKVLTASSIEGEKEEVVKSLITTNDGGYLIGGNFKSPRIQLGSYELVNEGSYPKGMLAKYSENGEVQWAISIGSSSNEDEINSIIKTSDGGFIVRGKFGSTQVPIGDYVLNKSTTSNSSVIIKFVPTDNGEYKVDWATSIEGNGTSNINSIIEVSDAGYVAVGNFNKTIQVGESVLKSTSSDKGMIIKYSQAGQVEWVTMAENKISTVIQTSDEGLLIGGTSYISKYSKKANEVGYELEWNKEIEGEAQEILQTSNNGLIIRNKTSISKYNYVEGEEIYIKEWKISSIGTIQSIIKSSDDGFIVAGYFSNSIQVGTDELISSGSSDAMIIKFDSQGNEKWAKSIGGSNSDYIYSIVELSNGTVLAGGSFSSSDINLDGKTLPAPENNSSDGIILKVSNMPTVSEVKELIVENRRKEYKITTDVKEIDGEKGGKITGEDFMPYETVKHGGTSEKPIIMEPNTGYEIISVTVNGKEWPFSAGEDGIYTMPDFVDVREDKHIVVTYSQKSNKIVIKKIDSDTQEPIPGVKFKLEQIESESSYNTQVQTNSQGEAITQVPFGKYRITELNTPEGYLPLEKYIIIDFEAEDKKVVEIQNIKDDETEEPDDTIAIYDAENSAYIIKNKASAKVIVHHYLKENGVKTEQPVAETEKLEGKPEQQYKTKPHMDLKKYDLERDEITKQYVIPTNAVGNFKSEEVIKVDYYYEAREIPLIVHHYIQDTEEPVPLENGEKAEAEEYSGAEGSSYTTKSLLEQAEENPEKAINPKYELVEEPGNKNGTYQGDEVIVNYYYRVKKLKVVTKVKPHEETDEFGETIQVDGGTILGQNQDPYETVIYGENSQNEIKATPATGYIVKSITINNVQQEFEPNEDGTVDIEKFLAMTEDKEVVVEFERTPANVIVHHYLVGTKTKVPSREKGKQVDDENKDGYVGKMYATSPSPQVKPNYECVSNTDNTSGYMEEETIEVTYYYSLKQAEILKNQISKTATSQITEESGKVKYTINYEAEITEYIGDATIKIVDTLPYKIDEASKENLSGGVYDATKNTITWTEKVSEIDTYSNPESGKINIQKVIELVFLDIDYTKKTFENKVTGTIKLEETDQQENTDEAKAETSTEFTKTVEVTKIWNHTNNIYEIPKQIKIKLQKVASDGSKQDVAEHILDSSNKVEDETLGENKEKWKYTFEGLTKYDDDGNEIEYEIIEEEVEQNELQYYNSSVDNNTKTVTNTYIGPIISASKQATIGSDKNYVVEGDIITYTITAKNDGQIGKEVIIRDTIPEGTSFVENSIKIDTQTTTYTSQDLETGIPVMLKANSQKILSFDVTANYSPINGKIRNVAYVSEKETNETITEYKSPDTKLITSVEKTGTEKMNSTEELVNYTINYTATINNFVGKAEITIVDKLPYEIDVANSNLDNGQYNQEEKTITWTEIVENLEAGKEEDPIITRTKSILLKYIYPEEETFDENIVNTVTATTELKEPNPEKQEQPENPEIPDEITVETDEKNDDYEVLVELPTKVVVHHYFYDEETGEKTEIEVAPKEEKEGKVGESYTTTKSSQVPENYECMEEEPENHSGKMTKAPIEVNYYYTLKEETISSEITKTAKVNKSGENQANNEENNSQVEVLTNEGEPVEYTISYKVKVENYIGKVKIAIVDTLPAQIDTQKSKLAGGTYNAENNTITWEEVIENVNTYKEGNLTQDNPEDGAVTNGIFEKTVEKQILIVYKGQDLVADLTNNVKGTVTTYYPDNHPRKANEEKKTETKEDSSTVKQGYDIPFNFSVTKKIAQVSMDGKEESISKDGKIIKLEVIARKVLTSKVEVKYLITVTNTGKIAGTSNVREVLPEGFQASNNNPNYWKKQDDGTLLTNVELEPGQSKELEVVTLWKNGNDNFGTMKNRVQLEEIKNSADYVDSNKDDNEDYADVIMSIKTGEEQSISKIVLTTIGVICLIILGTAYQISRKTNNTK